MLDVGACVSEPTGPHGISATAVCSWAHVGFAASVEGFSVARKNGTKVANLVRYCPYHAQQVTDYSSIATDTEVSQAEC